MKYSLPPLTSIRISSGAPMVTFSHNFLPRPFPCQTFFKPVASQLHEPVKTMPVFQTLLPPIHIHQSAYPFIFEDNSLIQLTTTKNISESVPRFAIQTPISERLFEDVCVDQSVQISPKNFGFIPLSAWSAESVTFGTLVSSFFRRRNSTSSKFPYKLYNALRITEFWPDYFPHIGVKWITDSIIWVNRESFARLLGVKTIEGGLFHQQGNFPSHGFEELSFEESEKVAAQLGLGKIDLSVMRLIRHTNGLFRRDSKESDLERCKWKGA